MTARRKTLSLPIWLSNAFGIACGTAAMWAILAGAYWATVDPIPAHTLLVRDGYAIRQWHLSAPVTVCTDGRIYPMSNWKNPCAGYSPWIQP
jgi:hypothetical protein